MNKVFTFVFAIFVSLTALVVSGVSAVERGGTILDQLLMVSISLAVCIGSQFILAISRHYLSWLLWLLCFMGSIYSHITFLSYASHRAGNVHAQSDIHVIRVEREIEATREALLEIEARPATTVAADLAVAKSWKKRRALEVELSEAARASRLQEKLIALTNSVAVTGNAAATNLVTAGVARVTGSNPESVDLIIGLGFSVLIELIGGFLWFMVFHGHAKERQAINCKSNSITELELAVRDGKIRGTVKEIRKYFRCSQERAIELRRQLQTDI